MNKVIIHGVEAYNFGSNNYSFGMEAVVFNPANVTVKQIKEMDGVFLHPTCKPNRLEIFALLGTQEQFDKFYPSCVEAEMAKLAQSKLGVPNYEDSAAWQSFVAFTDDLVASFIPWYDYAEPFKFV